MPEKSTKQRTKAAKKEGVPLMTRQVEPGASPHAMKKSRHNLREEVPPDRRVRRKSVPGDGAKTKPVGLSTRAPGDGKTRRDQPKTLDFVDAIQARQEKLAELVEKRPKRTGIRRPATVLGRKKPPSQMGVRRKGGPRKRLRIHGG